MEVVDGVDSVDPVHKVHSVHSVHAQQLIARQLIPEHIHQQPGDDLIGMFASLPEFLRAVAERALQFFDIERATQDEIAEKSELGFVAHELVVFREEIVEIDFRIIVVDLRIVIVELIRKSARWGEWAVGVIVVAIVCL